MSALTMKASGRAALVLLAIGLALLMLTSVLASGARAAEPTEVGPIEGDACQALGYGVDGTEFIVPTGDRYSETFDLPHGVSVQLTSPSNRKWVDFTVTGATVNGGLIFNRVDQSLGNWYDYLPEGGVASGRLEPPPRDSGNDKKIVLCFDVRTEISIDKITVFGDGQQADGPSDYIPTGDITFEYRVFIPGDSPAESLKNVVVEDLVGATRTGVSGPIDGDDGDGVLELGEVWLYQVEDTAVEGPYTNTGEVSAIGVTTLRAATASDDSGYFGVTTSVLSLDISNNGVGDENYIDVGEQVDWTITVGNVGSQYVDNVVVKDGDGAVVCDLGQISANGQKSCFPSETATAGENTLSVSTSGDGICVLGLCDPAPVGPVSESYFGVVIDVTVEVTPNGVINNEGELPIVTTPIVEWTVKVTNNSNVPLTTVIGAESDSDRSCTITSLPVFDPEDPTANVATCTFNGDTVVEGVVQSAGFTVNGESPTGPIDEIVVDPVFFYGGFDCGDTTFAGGPFEVDSPLTGVWLGPRSDEGACAFPIDVSSESTIEPLTAEQRVSVVPEEGFEFVGTSVVTIEWDAEIPDKGLLVRTFQELEVGGEITEREIPVCGGPEAVEIERASTTDFYYQLVDPDKVYDQAVPDGFDTCLIQTATITRTIDPDDEGGGVNGPLPLGSYSITIEVFYVFNDPIFVRR